MNKISALIHTKNSENTVEAALKSVQFADEIVVVDMESQDKTLEIVRSYTNKVYKHEDVGYVEPARNFGLSKLSGDWVLVIDADEEVSKCLKKKLIELATGDHIAWELPRKNLIWGKWMQHTGLWPDYVVRFFPKGKVSWNEKIHKPPTVEGELRKLPVKEEFAIIHHNYSNVFEFVERMNKYTTITSNNLSESYEPNEIVAELLDDFLRRYYGQLGYQDGEVGLYLSLMQAYYQFLVALKVREKHGFEKNVIEIEPTMEKFISDLNYWMRTRKVNESTNIISTFFWKLRRKIGL